MASKPNWRKIVGKALLFLIEGVVENVHEAVRKALKEQNVKPNQLSVADYDNLTSSVEGLNKTIEV